MTSNSPGASKGRQQPQMDAGVMAQRREKLPLALDQNLASRWRTWEPARPGMYLEVDFDRPASPDIGKCDWPEHGERNTR